MPSTTVRRTIEASADKVWDALDDFGNTQVYNPAIARSKPTSDIKSGLGATRHCDIDSAGKKHVQEEITAYDPASRTFTVELVGGSGRPPMEKVEAHFDVKELAPDRSEVAMTFDLTTKGPIQAAMAMMAKGMLSKAGNRVLAGLDHHATTGENVQELDKSAIR
ncbi:MAG: SRPBCC family protein [Acidimicrobiia bacterium]|nr:SRPBCC family protein [Acidimicrobiia bacterium]